MAHIRPKLHNCVKKGFLGKNHQYYPFQSIMSHHAKMFQKKKNNLCDRSWDIRLNNFGPNWTQILLFFEKEIFWENWLTLLCSTHYATMSQKNNGRSCDIRCWSFGPNWTQITHLPLQGIFLKKLIFSLLQIPHHNNTMFKKK